ncbi:MAG: ABC transporter permease [Actinobacteria bacterium]|nr:ABC transporter permease [Actinomycetota bacterium]
MNATAARVARAPKPDLTGAAASWLVLFTLAVVASILSSDFLDKQNLLNIGRQAAPLAVVSLGQTIVILGGGIDVSVGAVMSLTTVVVSTEMNGDPAMVIPAVLLVLALGAAIGLVNGFLISRVGTDPFVTTLAAMLIISGAALVYTQGSPTNGLTPGFRQISEGEVLGIPASVFFAAGAFAFCWFILRRTVWGRTVYALGGNMRATFLSGRRTALVQAGAYVASSLFAVLAGLLLAARIGTGAVSAGTGFELESIAAALIGGTAFGGGRGRISGTIAGVLILIVLFNLVNLLGLPSQLQQIVRGAVIVLGVALYSRRAVAGS